MPMRVKICGITNAQDALLAEHYGADAIGLIFVPESKRFVSAQQAKPISNALSPLINRVGVFRNSSLEHIREIAQELKLDTIQLHGHEDAVFAKALGRDHRVIKAISFSKALDLNELKAFPADALLLDGLKPGSGESFDWSQAAFLKAFPRLILAGGLTPENVQEAIAALRPYAVDLASGVEASVGKKDPVKLKTFISRAKAFNQAD